MSIASLLSIYGFYKMFSQFAQYDDEGYMLSLLRESGLGGVIYKDFNSQYGPLFHWTWNSLFSLLRLEYTHDSGRWITLMCWVLSSTVMGIGFWRQSQSLILGIIMQMTAFEVLERLIAEPMHPIGLLSLLVSLLYLVLTMNADSRLRSLLIGLLIAAMGAVKINFGVLAFIGMALYQIATSRLLERHPYLRIGLLFSLAVPPLLLIRGNHSLSLLFGASLVSIMTALSPTITRARKTDAPKPEWLIGLALGFGLLLLIATSRGSGARDLLQGIVLRPLNQGEIFSVELRLPNALMVASLTSLFFAYFFSYRYTSELIASPCTIFIASLIGSLMLGMGTLAMIPFAWTAALVDRFPVSENSSRRAMELPALALLLFLTVYPVAGSQIATGSLLLLPLFGTLVHRGIQSFRVNCDLPWPLKATSLFLVSITCLAGLKHAYSTLRMHGYYYAQRTSLNLYGARLIRLPPPEAKRIQTITYWINSKCDTFYSLPGLNSFHILARQSIPGRAPGTAWMTLLTREEQERVVRSLRASSNRRQCALRDDELLKFWQQGRLLQSGPLVRYLEEEFAPVRKVGSTWLLRKKSAVPYQGSPQ